MKIIAIVQARLGSTRLPNKVIKEINNTPMIELLLARLSQSQYIDKIVVATSINQQDDMLKNLVESLGYECFRGDEEDVLRRFYLAAKDSIADGVVRITADCPLIDSELIDECIYKFKSEKVDYVCNTIPETFPDGLDVEVMSFDSLKKAYNESKSKFDREHVTSYIRNSDEFTKKSIINSEDLSGIRWTVDELNDFIVIDRVFNYFYPNILFNWRDVLELQRKQPKIFFDNQDIVRNEGSKLNEGQKLYKRAKKIIPGGNMLLSKRPEMFLPDNWPAYFKKSKGCKVTDLDGTEYYDMSIMGIGTNILGYSHPEVDEAVIKTVKKGNMSTLNCPEEVYLAEKLIDAHPWADMARFSRAGGEINSIAIRIARAATGKDKVAICGYHGWHDWYLSSNLNSNKNLDGHLLPGLNPKGVPRGLTGTTLPFNYNDFEQLERLIYENKGEIAAIKMEVRRSDEPIDNFLVKVRKLASKNNIVLIFDECTAGFRETFGGLHKKYDVEPDLAIFAKALGNGYAISACIGKQEFMQAAQDTFISSTFWTERIGPTAGIKTLEVMEREQSWETITRVGKEISKNWKSLAKKYELEIDTWGIPALSGFTIKSSNSLAYKTLITQEMLKKNYLAANSVYVCTEHKQEIIDGYFESLDGIFKLIKECEEGRDINLLLDGPVCHSGFKRLN